MFSLMVHRHVARAFVHDLDVVLPCDARQFSLRLELRELRLVIRIRNRPGTQPVAEGERDVVHAHDLADFAEMRVRKILLMMGKAPLGEDRATA
jgi:hypothetical protein